MLSSEWDRCIHMARRCQINGHLFSYDALGDFFAGAGVDPAVEFAVEDLGLGLGVELAE